MSAIAEYLVRTVQSVRKYENILKEYYFSKPIKLLTTVAGIEAITCDTVRLRRGLVSSGRSDESGAGCTCTCSLSHKYLQRATPRRASDALVMSIMSVQLFSLLRTAFSRLAIEHIQLATDLQRVDSSSTVLYSRLDWRATRYVLA